MQPQKNTGIHTTGVYTGVNLNIWIDWGTVGTMMMVPTGVEDNWVTTVVVDGQWQVGTTKNVFTL